MPDVATTADWISAVGTVIAAGGTVGALVFAARAARAASKSAEAASNAVQLEALPLLLDAPYENYTDYEHEYPWPLERADGIKKTPMRGQIGLDPRTGTFAVPVRNVGRGVARIERYEISIASSGASYGKRGGEAVPVGEDVWLSGRPDQGSDFYKALQLVPSPLHERISVIFSATYTDNAGKQPQQFAFGLGSKGGESAWRVLSTETTRLD
jgi:hypothetical protein